MQALVVLMVLGAGGVASWGLFMGPIGKAVARWIEARTPQAQGQLMAELAEVEMRVTRLERVLREMAPARGRRLPRSGTD